MPLPTPAEVDAFVEKVFPAVGGRFRCESLQEREAVVRWPFDKATLRPGGFISGPTQFAATDLALWYLSFACIGLEAMSVTSDLHIQFLRPAAGGDLLAKATLLRAGKSRISGRVDLWIDGSPDRLVAHATGNYALLTS